MQQENPELRVKVETIKSKVEFGERQFKKNNLIYIGIDEGNGETANHLEQKALSLITYKLQVKPDDIASVYRIGKCNGRFPRPVLIALASYKKKYEIISNRSKLRGTDIFVIDDLTHKPTRDSKNAQLHA